MIRRYELTDGQFAEIEDLLSARPRPVWRTLERPSHHAQRKRHAGHLYRRIA